MTDLGLELHRVLGEGEPVIQFAAEVQRSLERYRNLAEFVDHLGDAGNIREGYVRVADAAEALSVALSVLPPQGRSILRVASSGPNVRIDSATEASFAALLGELSLIARTARDLSTQLEILHRHHDQPDTRSMYLRDEMIKEIAGSYERHFRPPRILHEYPPLSQTIFVAIVNVALRSAGIRPLKSRKELANILVVGST